MEVINELLKDAVVENIDTDKKDGKWGVKVTFCDTDISLFISRDVNGIDLALYKGQAYIYGYFVST